MIMELNFENRLVTTRQFLDAKRNSRRVKLYHIDTGELEGVGIVFNFGDNCVQILEESVGLLWYVRDQYKIYLALDQIIQPPKATPIQKGTLNAIPIRQPRAGSRSPSSRCSGFIRKPQPRCRTPRLPASARTYASRSPSTAATTPIDDSAP